MNVAHFLYALTDRGAAEYVRLTERMRRVLGLTRRVGFLGISGGVGTSTVAGLSAELFARQRASRTLLVDATGDHAGALYRAGAQSLDGTTATPQAASLETVKLPPNARSANQWWNALAKRQRATELSVTDWGHLGVTDIAEVAALSHAVGIVCTTTRADMTRAHDLALAVKRDIDAAAFVVAVDTHRKMGRAPKISAELASVPMTVISHDRKLSDVPGASFQQLRASTQLGLVQATVSMIDLIVDTGEAHEKQKVPQHPLAEPVRQASVHDAAVQTPVAPTAPAGLAEAPGTAEETIVERRLQ